MAGAAAAKIHPLGSGGNSASAWILRSAPATKTHTRGHRKCGLTHAQHHILCSTHVHRAQVQPHDVSQQCHSARAARARTSDTRDTSQALHHKPPFLKRPPPPRPSSLERHCVGQSGGGNSASAWILRSAPATKTHTRGHRKCGLTHALHHILCSIHVHRAQVQPHDVTHPFIHSSVSHTSTVTHEGLHTRCIRSVCSNLLLLPSVTQRDFGPLSCGRPSSPGVVSLTTPPSLVTDSFFLRDADAFDGQTLRISSSSTGTCHIKWWLRQRTYDAMTIWDHLFFLTTVCSQVSGSTSSPSCCPNAAVMSGSIPLLPLVARLS